MTNEEIALALTELDIRVGQVLNLNLDQFVSNYQLEQKQYVDLIELANALDAHTPNVDLSNYTTRS